MENEEVFCIKRNLLPSSWLGRKNYRKLDLKNVKNFINDAAFEFKNRTKIENNNDYKQIIPYILICSENKIFTYKRKGKETRLHNLCSVGIGGHIELIDEDSENYKTIINGARRELQEELGLKNLRPQWLGIINEEIYPVGSVHIGFVFKIKLGRNYNIKISQEVKNYEWNEIKSGFLKDKKLELWSELALNLI